MRGRAVKKKNMREATRLGTPRSVKKEAGGGVLGMGAEISLQPVGGRLSRLSLSPWRSTWGRSALQPMGDPMREEVDLPWGKLQLMESSLEQAPGRSCSLWREACTEAGFVAGAAAHGDPWWVSLLFRQWTLWVHWSSLWRAMCCGAGKRYEKGGVAEIQCNELMVAPIPLCSSGWKRGEWSSKAELWEEGCFSFVLVSHHPAPFLMGNKLNESSSGWVCFAQDGSGRVILSSSQAKSFSILFFSPCSVEEGGVREWLSEHLAASQA